MLAPRLVFVAALIAVAACSGSDDAAPASDAAPVSSQSSVESTRTDPPATDPPATDPPGTDAPVAGPPATDPLSTDAPVADLPATDPPSTDSAGGDDADELVLVIDGPAHVRPSCASLTRGVSDFTLDAGGAVHDVRIYVPETISSDPVPTVLNWHGLGSNGPDQAAFSGYEMLAEAEGFVVVHATGVEARDDGRNSWELTDFDTPERDDLAFADALIDTVVADWCGDPARIYSTGFSNGGFFTAELVCNRSERIAAAVSVAGITHPASCEPERAVPYIAFHGTDDGVVPFAGGGESTLSNDSDLSGFLGLVMPDEFAEFAADAGCDLEPGRVEQTAAVISYDYSGCADGTPMTFYEIVGGAHTWPDSPRADQLTDFGVLTKDIAATADGWAFMSQHSL
jgi:polyhydroxybutyrate depolymerase